MSAGIATLIFLGAFMITINTGAESAKAESSENVSFNLDFNYITADYSPIISIPTKNIEPGGGSTDAEINLDSKTMTITLTVPGVGSADLDIDPLGEHSYNVPGLYYNYGIAQFGIELYVKGTITGNTIVNGSGNGTTGALIWDSSGSKTVHITSSPNSTDGDTINLTLDDIEYSMWIKITASGEVLGAHKEITILDYQKLGSIQGDPPSVTGVIYIKHQESVISSMLSSLSGIFSSPTAVGLLIAIIAIAAAAYYYKKRGFPAEDKMDEIESLNKNNITVVCPHCGYSSIILRDAVGKWVRCPKCGQIFQINEEKLDRPNRGA